LKPSVHAALIARARVPQLMFDMHTESDRDP
jgi:hypothetical protein